MTESDNDNLIMAEQAIDVGLFIELVQQYEYLFNISNKLYKDSKKKNEAWHEIATTLNSTDVECQKLWKRLRDKFVKESSKCRSGSEAPELVWEYYNSMLFYKKYHKPRRTYTTTITKKPKPSFQTETDQAISSSNSGESSLSALSQEWNTITTILSNGGIGGESERQEEPITPNNKRKSDDDNLKEVLGAAKNIFAHIKNSKGVNATFGQYRVSGFNMEISLP